MQKILIVNLGGMGDVLLSTPALRSLRECYPRTEISMLLAPSGYALAKRFPYIDNIFTFQMGYDGTVPLGTVLANCRVLLTLRKNQFDLAINMRTLGSKKSAQKIKYLFHLINPLKTMGRDTEGRGHFFDIRIPESTPGERCEMEYDIDTVQALGAQVHHRSIDVEINNASIETVHEILKLHGIDREDVVIGIHPGGRPSHRWGIKNFAELIQLISSKSNCKFVITGGMSETELGRKLQQDSIHNIINVAGKLSLEQLFALIKRCDLFITNDTGPMHIAAAIKSPLVAIFGPGYIDRYDPRNIHDSAEVIYKGRDCAPCDKVECASMECLGNISPEEVAGACLRLLGT